MATDGSAKDDVAGYSVVVDDPSNHFAGGDDAEDQTPFRAEVCALQLALEALDPPGRCLGSLRACYSSGRLLRSASRTGSLPLNAACRSTPSTAFASSF